MPATAHKPHRPVSRALVAMALALASLGAPAQAEEDAMSAGFAFDLIDPGFCMMPPAEFDDDMMRGLIAEQGDDIPVIGESDEPAEAMLAGEGYFARGAGRNAVAATLYTFIIPEEGALTALCVALIPVNEMNATEGEVMLHSPETAPEEGDYYMAFARLIGRDGDETINLGELSNADGAIDFAEDQGDIITGSLFLSGEMSEGATLQIGVDFTLFEEEALRFVDLSGN